MGRRSREKKQTDKETGGENAVSRRQTGPVRFIDGLLIGVVIAAVALVGWWFELTVNRVFDVPKALALKTLGGSAFLLWLVYGFFFGGFPWKSIRIFLVPVAAFLGAVGISTILSLDPWTSFYGVYERQFGLQGVLSCVGIFVVTATVIRTRNGGARALGVLMMIAGVIGYYGLLQAVEADPFGFRQNTSKVYSSLGNATFAGNALALVFPVSACLAAAATVHAFRRGTGETTPRRNDVSYFLTGFVVIPTGVVLPILVSRHFGFGSEIKQLFFLVGTLGAIVITVLFGRGSTWGSAPLGDTADGRRANSQLAGALVSWTIGIFIGLLVTRTRGAWVATMVAVGSALFLVPWLFRDSPKAQRTAQVLSWGTLVAVFTVGALGITFYPNHSYSRTIRSIADAFDPSREVAGQGQGTRRYLWAESIRVLTDHDKTLERIEKDKSDLRSHTELVAKPMGTTERTIRSALVWPFGIGIETYRYAFMSHKSKRLEALDPMTNHDNPHNNYLYILASCGIAGLAAYLWFLSRLLGTGWKHFSRADSTLGDRAVALGVVVSFFGYAVYSIAGFDSVACSVFLYFFLGAVAVFFSPNVGEQPQPIARQLHAQWLAFTKKEGMAKNALWVQIVFTAALGVVLIWTVVGANQVHRAEQAFVPSVRDRTFEDRLAGMRRATEINSRESYYWQSLGGSYADAAQSYRDAATKRPTDGQARGWAVKGEELTRAAEGALYRALHHAWAPENLFISLFQLYYSQKRMDEAERALERALEHSPHLPPVRANLAALKVQRGAHREAISDCMWVLEIQPQQQLALRTCGRAHQQLNENDKARAFLEQARLVDPNDAITRRYIEELDRAIATQVTSPSTS